MSLPEDLMRKLSGGYYFTKIDLADAYNQIKLAPESQKRLHSVRTEACYFRRLPFGISSSPGYFQKIMEQLTSDLRGVAVYLDDILVSGNNAEEHIQNLRALLERLNEKGLRCKLENPRWNTWGIYFHVMGFLKGPRSTQLPRCHRPRTLPAYVLFRARFSFMESSYQICLR
ncbi:hypothetical protein M514_20807 [Trichuris suis]|uniref:Reverse transcriptase domain-containing protein n=1 Tax=Trichuris suis TaxID=68888 RepID=A0A085NBU5_9BILA|nr:hypothetical protein M514_20807 [Trichuris suis]